MNGAARQPKRRYSDDELCPVHLFTPMNNSGWKLTHFSRRANNNCQTAPRGKRPRALSSTEMRDVMREIGDVGVAQPVHGLGHGGAGADTPSGFIVVQRLDEIVLALMRYSR